jgi:hypothetical protein
MSRRIDPVPAVWTVAVIGFAAVFGLEQLLPAAKTAQPAAPAATAAQPAATAAQPAHADTPHHWWELWEGKQIRVGGKVGYTDECFVARDSPAAVLQKYTEEGGTDHILDKGDEVDVVENEPRDHSADAFILLLGGKANGVVNRFFRSDAACQTARQAGSDWRAAKAAEAAAADRKLDKYR